MSASLWGRPRKFVVENFPLSILGQHRPEIAMDRLRPNRRHWRAQLTFLVSSRKQCSRFDRNARFGVDLFW
jgi:hypothetical protein